MDREVASGTARKRRPLRPKRVIAILAAALASVAGLAPTAFPAHAVLNGGGRVWTPGGQGYAEFWNRYDGSEVVQVCDASYSDGYWVYATFKFEGSTEEPLWAPRGGCNYRMPSIRDNSGIPVQARVCATNGSTAVCHAYYTLGYP
jgi:hypothetical protein